MGKVSASCCDEHKERIVVAVNSLRFATTQSVAKKTGIDRYTVNTTLVKLFKQGRIARRGQIAGYMGRPSYIYCMPDSAAVKSA